MAPTSCSAGLRDGSSTMVGSVVPSAIGAESMIPLSDMNMSMSKPSMGLVVDRRSASRGQNATKSTVAKSTAGVEKRLGGGVVGLLLSETNPFASPSFLISSLNPLNVPSDVAVTAFVSSTSSVVS